VPANFTARPESSASSTWCASYRRSLIAPAPAGLATEALRAQRARARPATLDCRAAERSTVTLLGRWAPLGPTPCAGGRGRRAGRSNWPRGCGSPSRLSSALAPPRGGVERGRRSSESVLFERAARSTRRAAARGAARRKRSTSSAAVGGFRPWARGRAPAPPARGPRAPLAGLQRARHRQRVGQPAGTACAGGHRATRPSASQAKLAALRG